MYDPTRLRRNLSVDLPGIARSSAASWLVVAYPGYTSHRSRNTYDLRIGARLQLGSGTSLFPEFRLLSVPALWKS
jgi:hypothetical protein